MAGHRAILFLGALLLCTGCSATVIEPGHRGLLFDPQKGGLQHEILSPGEHRVGSGRIEDFDVTYSTRKEPIHVVSTEGLMIEGRVSIIYRPIIAELYQLDTEIGPRYYDEVIGPELRAAIRTTFAAHSMVDLLKGNAALEDQVEAEVRKRVAGKHVEISAITFESVELPPEVMTAVRERLLAEQIAQKKKIELESEAQREKMESEKAWQREKLELERNVERRRLEREAAGGR